jgi:capsular exopolysaccharide synthesis family protein
VLERSKESDLTRRLRVNNISVVDLPTVPKGPIKPNMPLNVMGGLVVGLLLGVGAAMGRGLLDRTVKTPDDVEQLLKATFLGLIPEIDESTLGPAPGKRKRRQQVIAPELIVHTNPMSGIAEASRSVRTNLIFTTPDRPYRVLLVTSSGPSEGKTTVACCVSVAMAQAGKRVLLIDCDLRRPRIHRIFHVTGQESGGLTTALLDESHEDCAVQTEVPNLYVIPAGPIPPNPSELLHSERFKTFLNHMKERYDQIILDSPPLVAVTDATILSTIVDGTMVVVRAFKTSKDLAKHANRILSDVGARMAGVVLNAVNLHKDEYRYRYQYYRRDAYYSQTPGSGPADGSSGSATASSSSDASAAPPN